MTTTPEPAVLTDTRLAEIQAEWMFDPNPRQMIQELLAEVARLRSELGR